MSARVLNPAMMTEMSRVIAASGGPAATSVGRVAPSRAALARVRRDLFGPVDHAAARALAERELRAQSILDAERWGFDFRLEVPKASGNARFEWEPITSRDVVPEPYALRGMPYLRKHSPPTPRKASVRSPRTPRPVLEESPVQLMTVTAASTAMLLETVNGATLTPNGKLQQEVSERTPPQESRVPLIGETTPDVVPKLGELSMCSVEKPAVTREQPTTPVTAVKKLQQPAITSFMKSRKRTLHGTSKSLTAEPPEKLARNAGQIR